MEDKAEETYNQRCADVYDQWFGYFDEAAVDVLEELAGGGRVLELGIGTGTVALPLAARGIEVVGIDASPEMVAALRAKPGGAASLARRARSTSPSTSARPEAARALRT